MAAAGPSNQQPDLDMQWNTQMINFLNKYVVNAENQLAAVLDLRTLFMRRIAGAEAFLAADEQTRAKKEFCPIAICFHLQGFHLAELCCKN